MHRNSAPSISEQILFYEIIELLYYTLRFVNFCKIYLLSKECYFDSSDVTTTSLHTQRVCARTMLLIIVTCTYLFAPK